jgi:hypothetical protein
MKKKKILRLIEDMGHRMHAMQTRLQKLEFEVQDMRRCVPTRELLLSNCSIETQRKEV